LHQGDTLNLEIDYNCAATLGLKFASLTILTDEGAALTSNGNSFTYQISANVVPEPSSLALLGVGAV
jgi:hypothetical protein